MWAYPGEEPKKRTIHLVGADMCDPQSYPAVLKDALSKGVDFYYQRAGSGLNEKYSSFIDWVARNVKTDGFLLLDIKPLGKKSVDPLLYIKNAKMEKIASTPEMDYWADFIRPRDDYGWDIRIYKKMPDVCSDGGMNNKQLQAFARKESTTAEDLARYIEKTGLYYQVDIIRDALKGDPVKLAEFNRLIEGAIPGIHEDDETGRAEGLGGEGFDLDKFIQEGYAFYTVPNAPHMQFLFRLSEGKTEVKPKYLPEDLIEKNTRSVTGIIIEIFDLSSEEIQFVGRSHRLLVTMEDGFCYESEPPFGTIKIDSQNISDQDLLLKVDSSKRGSFAKAMEDARLDNLRKYMLGEIPPALLIREDYQNAGLLKKTTKGFMGIGKSLTVLANAVGVKHGAKDYIFEAMNEPFFKRMRAKVLKPAKHIEEGIVMSFALTDRSWISEMKIEWTEPFDVSKAIAAARKIYQSKSILSTRMINGFHGFSLESAVRQMQSAFKGLIVYVEQQQPGLIEILKKNNLLKKPYQDILLGALNEIAKEDLKEFVESPEEPAIGRRIKKESSRLAARWMDALLAALPIIDQYEDAVKLAAEIKRKLSPRAEVVGENHGAPTGVRLGAQQLPVGATLTAETGIAERRKTAADLDKPEGSPAITTSDAVDGDEAQREKDDEKVKVAREILANTAYRPHPLQISGLNFGNIDEAAKSLSYPVYNIDRFIHLHKLALSLLENRIAKLLLTHEKDKPIYVIIGRDGEMIYDAMVSLSQGTELAERIHMVNISRALAELVEDDPNKDNIKDRITAYLAQNGISTETFSSSRKFVFIDAQYVGSIFDAILEVMETSREEMADKLTGYLIMRADEESDYNELGWAVEPEGDSFFDLFFNVFGRDFARKQTGSFDSYGYLELANYSTIKRLNWALGNYLQIQPKFARSGCVVEFFKGELRALAREEDRGYPIEKYYYWETHNVTEPIRHPNADLVDPVAAIKLQTLTVDYFSMPERRRMILSAAMDTNPKSDKELNAYLKTKAEETDRRAYEIMHEMGYEEYDIEEDKDITLTDQERKEYAVLIFMQILQFFPKLENGKLRGYKQAKHIVETDDSLISLFKGYLEQIDYPMLSRKEKSHIIGWRKLTLLEQLYRKYSALDLWRELGLEEEFINEFPDPESFWKSALTLYEIYEILLIMADDKGLAPKGNPASPTSDAVTLEVLSAV